MSAGLRTELRATARLAGPLALAQMAIMVMAMVDTAVVGRHSQLELAGVALGNSITFGVIVFGTGFCLALEPLVAQALGQGSPERAWGWWRLGLRISVLLGLPLALLAVAITMATPWMGVEAAVAERATAYLVARVPAMVLYLVYVAARAYLQSRQQTRALLTAAVVANVFNLIADVVLVNGDAGLVAWGLPAIGAPALGGVGAGIATSISTGVMALMMVRDVHRFKPVGLTRAVPLPPMGPLWRLGIPVGLQTAAEYVVFSTVGVVAATIDQPSAGAHQVALHISTTSYMAALGVAGAASARVGLAVGRGDAQGTRHAGVAAVGIGMCVMVVSAVLFLLFPEVLARVFAPDQPQVIAIATELIGIAALFQLFDGLQVVMAGALRGAGDVRLPFLVNLGMHWAVGFPLAMVLAFGAGMGVVGLWYGLVAGLAGVSVLLSWRFIALTRTGIASVEQLSGPETTRGEP